MAMVDNEIVLGYRDGIYSTAVARVNSLSLYDILYNIASEAEYCI